MPQILPVLLGAASSLPPALRARSRDRCPLSPETWPLGGPSLPLRVSAKVTQSLRQGHVLIHSTTHPGAGAAAIGSRDPTPPAQSQPLGPARASRPPGRTEPTVTNPLPASPVSHFHRTRAQRSPALSRSCLLPQLLLASGGLQAAALTTGLTERRTPASI